MNLIRKGHGHTHRGVIGVESAIVMIAFVIVAAALAFVVLNMGFATTQKAKTSIISGLSEASSSLEISGKVTGIGDITDARLDVVSIPLKIASGGDSINLQNTTASVKYLSNTVEYDNIYLGVASTSTNAINVTEGWELANRHFNVAAVPSNPVNNTAGWTKASTTAIVYWTVGAGNQILDEGEHAVLSIAFSSDVGSNEERPQALDRIRAEILLPTGSPLTIERDIPNITNTVVDLG